MVKYAYYLNRKRMYLDTDVYKKAEELHINWDEIEAENRRLKSIGHPKATYNTATMFLIDKKCSQTVNNGIGLIKKSDNKDLFGNNLLKRRMNNKGFIVDNITLMVSMLIMISLVVLLAAYVETQDNNMQSSQQDSVFKDTFHTSLGGFSSAVDKGLIVGLAILVTFLLYSAYNIGTNFSLFLMALLINIIVLFMLPQAEDFLVTSFYNNDYATAIASMPATFYVINHFTVFLTGLSVFLLIALFLKPGGGNESYG